MLDFASIADLAHFTENVLDRIRKQELPLNQSAIDILLEIIDALESLIQRRVGGEGEKEQAATAATLTEELKAKVSGLEAQELLERQGIIVVDSTGHTERLYSRICYSASRNSCT